MLTPCLPWQAASPLLHNSRRSQHFLLYILWWGHWWGSGGYACTTTAGIVSTFVALRDDAAGPLRRAARTPPFVPKLKIRTSRASFSGLGGY